MKDSVYLDDQTNHLLVVTRSPTEPPSQSGRSDPVTAHFVGEPRESDGWGFEEEEGQEKEEGRRRKKRRGGQGGGNQCSIHGPGGWHIFDQSPSDRSTVERYTIHNRPCHVIFFTLIRLQL